MASAPRLLRIVYRVLRQERLYERRNRRVRKATQDAEDFFGEGAETQGNIEGVNHCILHKDVGYSLPESRIRVIVFRQR